MIIFSSYAFFSHVDYVDGQRAMIQFPWSDGSVKNLHVDMAQLFEYQKQLSEAVVLYEKRVDWLASGSRRIFGAVTEHR